MDAPLRNLFIGLLAYVAVAVLTFVLVWKSTRVRGPRARVLCRSAAFAVLFSPTAFACGAIAPVPFLILIMGDLYVLATRPVGPCGYQSLPNAIMVVVVGLVFGLLHLYISRRQARRREQVI